MQLILMNKVKNGELTIEDALDQAQRDREQLLLKKQSQSVEVLNGMCLMLDGLTWKLTTIQTITC